MPLWPLPRDREHIVTKFLMQRFILHAIEGSWRQVLQVALDFAALAQSTVCVQSQENFALSLARCAAPSPVLTTISVAHLDSTMKTPLRSPQLTSTRDGTVSEVVVVVSMVARTHRRTTRERTPSPLRAKISC